MELPPYSPAFVMRARKAADAVLTMQASNKVSTDAVAIAAALWFSIYANGLLDIAEGKR